jgi:hypothetical protein
MTTADLSGPTEEPNPTHASADGTSPASPGRGQNVVEAAGWLLRTTALTAVVAGAAAVIVLPGARGNASEYVVVWADRITATLAYFLLGLLTSLIIWGAVELARIRSTAPIVARIVLVGVSSGVVLLSTQAFKDRLPPLWGLLLVAGAAVSAIVASYGAVLRPHTRAAAGLLLALAFAAVARLGAWEMAARANEHADLALFHWSRGLATAGVMFEAFGQLIAVTWLGTRSRLAGQMGSTAALLVAFVVTWGVARGVHAGAAPWQYVLHTALADSPGIPPPFGLDAVATFLVPSSMLLAFVAAAQPGQVSAVVASVALALVSHGAFDAPLRALCVVAASIWITLASTDDASMWQALLGQATRQRRSDDAD